MNIVILQPALLEVLIRIRSSLRPAVAQHETTLKFISQYMNPYMHREIKILLLIVCFKWLLNEMIINVDYREVNN